MDPSSSLLCTFAGKLDDMLWTDWSSYGDAEGGGCCQDTANGTAFHSQDWVVASNSMAENSILAMVPPHAPQLLTVSDPVGDQDEQGCDYLHIPRPCASLLDDDASLTGRQNFRILASHYQGPEMSTTDVPNPTHEHYDSTPLLTHTHFHQSSCQESPLLFSDIDGIDSSCSRGHQTRALSQNYEEERDDDLEDPNSLERISADVVLKEEIMEELQDALPFCKRGESFWLQYSLVRDGASLDSMLSKARDSASTILAVETLDGEVFGAYLGMPWKVSQDYYGSGQSFLWRRSAQEDGEVEVFKFAYLNHNIQLLTSDRLIVGGSGGDSGGTMEGIQPPCLLSAETNSTLSSCDDTVMTGLNLSSRSKDHTSKAPEWGFGLWLDHDLLRGSSSPCSTFQSPSLSQIHANGSCFEIRNIEVWALTPCISVEQALRNQQRRRILSGTLIPQRAAAETFKQPPNVFGTRDLQIHKKNSTDN